MIGRQDYQCGTRRGFGGWSIQLLSARHDRLEVRTGGLPMQCEGLAIDSLTTTITVRNSRGEEASFEVEFGDPAPRTRGVRRP